MDSSAAPRAALAAATERPSDVSAAIAEWGTVPQTPTAITTSGSKVHVCGSCALGTRRATEAHGLRMSHWSYLACLRPTATPRLASSATVNSMGITVRRLWSRQYRSGRSGLPASSSSLATAEVAPLSPRTSSQGPASALRFNYYPGRYPSHCRAGPASRAIVRGPT